MKKIIHVHCPCCHNKRLFDLQPGATGIIQIKCPICKSVVAVKLDTAKIEAIHTEQIGA